MITREGDIEVIASGNEKDEEGAMKVVMDRHSEIRDLQERQEKTKTRSSRGVWTEKDNYVVNVEDKRYGRNIRVNTRTQRERNRA